MNVIGLIKKDMKEDYVQKLLKNNRFIDESLFKKLKSKKKCMICESKVNDNPLEIHHIIPLRNGGLNIEKNLIAICKDCHIKIHDTDIENINRKLNDICFYITSGNRNNKEVSESERIRQREHTISQLKAVNNNLKLEIKQILDIEQNVSKIDIENALIEMKKNIDSKNFYEEIDKVWRKLELSCRECN